MLVAPNNWDHVTWALIKIVIYAYGNPVCPQDLAPMLCQRCRPKPGSNMQARFPGVVEGFCPLFQSLAQRSDNVLYKLWRCEARDGRKSCLSRSLPFQLFTRKHNTSSSFGWTLERRRGRRPNVQPKLSRN